MNFKELGISENLITILNKSGIKVPTDIQEQCITHIRNGKDLIGEAQTGTGKTLAFLLPIIENINIKSQNTQAIIITPTRELAIQISDEAKKLAEGNNINVLAAYGGKDVGSQLKKLKNVIHLIIATPGRLLDHLERKSIILNKLNTVVLDEADQILLMGFKNEVDKIMKYLPQKHQTLCFSATMDSSVKKLAYRYMSDPVLISIQKESITLDTIKQEVVKTTDRWKLKSLLKVLEEDNPFMAIIFCRTKRRADALELEMHKQKYNCKTIHSDIPQNKRERIIKSFRNAEIQYLIATDVASRGIDISGVSNIYNYDIPETPEIYIHRIGRTGRSGEYGYTCCFIDPKNNQLLSDIEKKINLKILQRIVNIEK